MNQLLTPQYLIIFTIALLVFGAWYYRGWRKKKNQKPADKKQATGEVHYNAIDAIIYDRTTSPFTWYEQKLEPAIVQNIVEAKTLGRQVVFNGKKVFRYYKLPIMAGAVNPLCYEGVSEPADVKNSPIAGYIDNQHPYIPILDDVSVDKNFMQKYGHLLVWLGVIAVVIALLIMDK